MHSSKPTVIEQTYSQEDEISSVDIVNFFSEWQVF
jgi:hypothetical protein